MVTQGVLEFQYQPDTSKTGLTANAGLPLYLDLAFRSGLVETLRRHLEVRRGGQGWTDEQVVLALVLLNLAGDESVSDLDVLEADEGFARLLRRVEQHGLSRRARLEKEALVATEQQWAEVCFVPSWTAKSKKQPEYRFLAIREPLRQPALPGMQADLPFPVMDFKSEAYKLFGVVTNRTGDGEEIIRWHRERCGKSEEAHAVMKQDLAGGRMPSGSFGENAAWWQIMVLALNLNTLFKREALGEGWISKRLKALRYALIGIPGKVVTRSRGLAVRICARHPAWEVLLRAHGKILALPLPTG